MKLSFITPTYNRADCILECVKSVASQLHDGSDVEHIIVDDGSTDNTVQLLKEFEAQYKHVKVIACEKNNGVNYARNRGIELASGDYVVLLDSDDRMCDGALQKIRKTVERNNGYRHFLFPGSFTTWEGQTKKEFTFQDYLLERVEGDFMPVVQANILKQNKFFEQFRAFEHLNWFRVIRTTQPLLYVPVETAVSINRPVNDSLARKIYKSTDRKILEENFEAKLLFLELYGAELKKHSPKAYYNKIFFIFLNGLRIHAYNANASIIRSSVPSDLLQRLVRIVFNNSLFSFIVKTAYSLKYSIE